MLRACRNDDLCQIKLMATGMKKDLSGDARTSNRCSLSDDKDPHFTIPTPSIRSSGSTVVKVHVASQKNVFQSASTRSTKHCSGS